MSERFSYLADGAGPEVTSTPFDSNAPPIPSLSPRPAPKAKRPPKRRRPADCADLFAPQREAYDERKS